MSITESHYLTVPLGSEAHRWAEQFAAEQTTPQKGKQVYLNTLAVLSVQNYLKWQQIETALFQSDSWKPGMRALFDVADLALPNIGKLACCPLLSGESALNIPQDENTDRIGYIAVRLNQALNTAELLGFAFASRVSRRSEPLPLSAFCSLDALIDEIHWRRRAVKLHRWLEECFEPDWRLPQQVISYQVRSKAQPTALESQLSKRFISRGKIIDLGSQPLNQSVALVLQLTPKTHDEEVDIRLRLYPTTNTPCLPPNLQVTLLDQAGTPCLEAQSRHADDWIQLEFGALPAERFSVQLSLGDTRVIEHFVV